jgi:hypothetical protein
LRVQLREELGPQVMGGKEAPPKRAFTGVNKKPDQIERRRKELEQWLWRLINNPDVARSKMLNAFLELSEAARLIQRYSRFLMFVCVCFLRRKALHAQGHAKTHFTLLLHRPSFLPFGGGILLVQSSARFGLAA